MPKAIMCILCGVHEDHRTVMVQHIEGEGFVICDICIQDLCNKMIDMIREKV